MTEALGDFKRRANISDGPIDDRWSRMVFHLPYAFHGKRMYIDTFITERKQTAEWQSFLQALELNEPKRDEFDSDAGFADAMKSFTRAISKSDAYRTFVSDKLERAQRASGQVGNLYAASIFLALMSTLESDAHDGSDLTGKRLGFVAYGSGSKSKVFEATVQPGFLEVAKNFGVFAQLEARTAVTYDQYEALHTKTAKDSIEARKGHFGLSEIGTEGPKLGARSYEVR